MSGIVSSVRQIITSCNFYVPINPIQSSFARKHRSDDRVSCVPRNAHGHGTQNMHDVDGNIYTYFA